VETINGNYLLERIFEIQQTNNNAGPEMTTHHFYALTLIPGAASRGDVQLDSAFINLFEARGQAA